MLKSNKPVVMFKCSKCGGDVDVSYYDSIHKLLLTCKTYGCPTYESVNLEDLSNTLAKDGDK